MTKPIQPVRQLFIGCVFRNKLFILRSILIRFPVRSVKTDLISNRYLPHNFYEFEILPRIIKSSSLHKTYGHINSVLKSDKSFGKNCLKISEQFNFFDRRQNERQENQNTKTTAYKFPRRFFLEVPPKKSQVHRLQPIE